MEDREIVELYWQRDEDAIRETEKKYGRFLSAIAYNVLYDAEDCRECLNDTYLAAWNSMPDKRPEKLSAYLGRIIRQIAIDRYRKLNSEKRAGSQYTQSLDEWAEILPDKAEPETELAERELSAAVGAFVRGLSPVQRRAFLGRYYYFDPVKTVAAYCGVSEAGLKSQLFRIRRRLKQYLKDEGYIE